MPDDKNNTPANDIGAGDDLSQDQVRRDLADIAARTKKIEFGKVRNYREMVKQLETEQNPDIIRDLETTIEFMDKAMEKVELDPADIDVIIKFASAPMQRIAVLANKSMDLQMEADRKMEILRSPLRDIEGLGTDLKNFVSSAFELTKTVAGGGAKAATSGMKKLTDIFRKWSGKKDEDKELSEADSLQQQYSNLLPELRSKITRIALNLDLMKKDLEELDKRVGELAAESLKTMNALGIYLGAGEELMQRYAEKYIPEAQADASRPLADAFDQENLSDTVAGQSWMTRRVRDLLQCYTQNQSQVVLARQTRKQIKEMIFTAENQKTNGVPMWISMLQNVATQVTGAKAAIMLKDNRGVGDTLSDLSLQAAKQTADINHELANDGSIMSHEKMIANAEEMIKFLGEEASRENERQKTLEGQIVAMKDVSQKVLAAAEATQKVRGKELDGDSSSERASRKRAAQAEKLARNAQRTSARADEFQQVAQPKKPAAAPVVPPAPETSEDAAFDAMMATPEKPSRRGPAPK